MSKHTTTRRHRLTRSKRFSIHDHDAFVVNQLNKLNEARLEANAALDAFHTRWGIDWTDYNSRTRKRRRR